MNERRSVLFALLFCLFSPVARASGPDLFAQRLALEDQIRARALEVLRPVDPTATVQVQLVLKSFDAQVAPLGVAATGIVPLNMDGSLGALSIERIVILGKTTIKPVPTWLRGALASAVKLDKVPVDLRVTAFSEAETRAIRESQAKESGALGETLKLINFKVDLQTLDAAIEKAGDKIIAMNKTQQLWFLGFIGALSFLGALLAFSIGSFKKSFSRTVEDKLVPALLTKPAAAENRAIAEAAVRSEPQPSGPRASAARDPQVSEAAPSVLANIFWDCYWTQNDGYAAHLWGSATAAQREFLANESGLPREYFEHILTGEAADLGLVAHISYARSAGEFNHLNQADLSALIHANKALYPLVTPLRSRTLELGIEDKLELMRAPAAEPPAKDAIPSTPSAPRALPSTVKIGQVTSADETFLWNHREGIAADIRRATNSAIWLADRDETYIAKIFAQLDARQIASCWIGPEEVLAIFQRALPTKKWEMIESYLASDRPSRASETYGYLVQAALYEETPAEQPTPAEAEAEAPSTKHSSEAA